MQTKVFQPDQLAAAAAELAAGELVAFPTETVYGLGADATNEAAVKKVYQAKGRPSDNPLIVHVADVATVKQYVADFPVTAEKLTQAFWPGSLTIILPLKPGAFAKTVTGGLNTAAFRNPRNQVTLDLIKQLGRPIVGPSANTSGKPSPTLAAHVLHDLTGKIAGVVDDGPTGVGLESTVIDLSTPTPTILRPGAVTKEDIEAVIGSIDADHHKVKPDEIPKAPGMKYKHYAPNAQVYVTAAADFKAAASWARAQGEPFGLMATDQVLAKFPVLAADYRFSLGDSIVTASQRLFDGLRHYDQLPEVKFIFAEEFPAVGLGVAYMNRVAKSAGQQYFVQK
ncbi:L-threonylcarbamoyladenylate synthase [Loigolactobacillus jiayinensis]|uniref:Threonylcarbamoyl-AMP synthase n=1 Tax=Loigolactobacillus jiayinensis TaxID=2486016 RepID=A0ABW1REI6_9LACO|nr:L-threonylcarbamoyladenylate synthase [Loigolactobacillus jiayinensis]